MSTAKPDKRRNKHTDHEPDNHLIAHAALTLLGQKGWSALTAETLAKTAKITPATAHAFLKSPCHTMNKLTAYITHENLGNYRHDAAASPRDSLFDILMIRFDVLQKYRAGILALSREARTNPKLAAALTNAMSAPIMALLQATQIAPITPLHKLGFAAIYAATLWVWQRDDTTDCARTMAALDGHLRRTEKLMLKFIPQSS
jgi:hypothetical protein